MAKQTINIGAAPNDGTGTPLRTSFDYTNQNFTELYTALGGGVGLPGSTTQVIFNDGGTNLAGDSGLTFNKTTDALTLAGPMTMASSNVTGGTIPANGTWLPAANTLEFAANSLAQYRIAPLGVFSWYDGAGGTRMTLNSTGLGVGITPTEKFEVGLAGSGTPRIRFVSFSDYAVIEYQRYTGSGANYYGSRILGGDGLYFYTSNAAAIGAQTFTTRFGIDVNGNALVGVASANANGGVLQLKSGITFPATQVAATDVNTLDDYKEGTFVPTIIGGTIAGVGTYTTQIGTFTKVGRVVTVSVWIIWTAHTGTGAFSIGTLPYTSSFAVTGASIGYISGVALTASNIATAYVAGTTFSIAQTPVGGGVGSNASISASGTISVSCTYIV
ncbi:MAG: hypothetical protein WCK04_00920 [Actinomycetes bacterium]